MNFSFAMPASGFRVLFFYYEYLKSEPVKHFQQKDNNRTQCEQHNVVDIADITTRAIIPAE